MIECPIEPLRQLVEYQKGKDLKPAPNLTAKHLEQAHFDKMKASNAPNDFSHSVSAGLTANSGGGVQICTPYVFSNILATRAIEF